MMTDIRTIAISTTLSIVLSGAVSWMVSQNVAKYQSIYTTKLESILKFNADRDELTSLAAAYIKRINTFEDVSDIQVDLRSEITKQMRQADELRMIFPSEHGKLIEQYQSALHDLAKAVPDATSPITMKIWAENFGKVFDRRGEVAAVLLKYTGINS